MELGYLSLVLLVLLELLELLDDIAGEFLGPCFCGRLDRFSIWAFLPWFASFVFTALWASILWTEAAGTQFLFV